MKALILAGGKGTRLNQFTYNTPKHLLPVANKPILFYVLDQIREVGIEDIGIVVSPQTSSPIKEVIGDGSKWDANITYILQSEPKGIAHAVKVAQDFLGDPPFLMFLGDNLIGNGVKELMEEFNAAPPSALILLKEVTNPSAFGVAEVDPCGNVIHLVEKPNEPKSNLAIVGAYIFSSEIQQAISQIEPSRRGELEITDAIQKLLEMGREVRSRILTGWWLDTGTKDNILKANRIVLHNNLKWDIRGEVDSKSHIFGRVEIRSGAKVKKSLIRGPVTIAEDCLIANSSIGPFTSIGARTIVDTSSINHSIILEDCHITKIEHLANNIITSRDYKINEIGTSG